MKENDKTLTASEAARQLDYTVIYLYSLLKEGKLRAEKIGRMWFIRQSEIDRYRKEHGR